MRFFHLLQTKTSSCLRFPGVFTAQRFLRNLDPTAEVATSGSLCRCRKQPPGCGAGLGASRVRALPFAEAPPRKSGVTGVGGLGSASWSTKAVTNHVTAAFGGTCVRSCRLKWQLREPGSPETQVTGASLPGVRLGPAGGAGGETEERTPLSPPL